MKPTIVKPVADPLDDIDRVAPVDSLMARQDRADLPGNRSDIPAAGGSQPGAELGSAAPLDPDDVALAEDADTQSLDDPDVALALENAAGQAPGLGPDDDEPIEEIERLGDDSRTV
jgi:hypothetical protein